MYSVKNEMFLPTKNKIFSTFFDCRKLMKNFRLHLFIFSNLRPPLRVFSLLVSCFCLFICLFSIVFVLRVCVSISGQCFRLIVSAYPFLFDFEHLQRECPQIIKQLFSSSLRISVKSHGAQMLYRYIWGLHETIYLYVFSYAQPFWKEFALAQRLFVTSILNHTDFHRRVRTRGQHPRSLGAWLLENRDVNMSSSGSTGLKRLQSKLCITALYKEVT